MSNLWQQKFQKSNPSEWTMDEFNQSWNWIFQDGVEQSIFRLGIIQAKSLQLRRQGVVKSAEMAACEVWRKAASPLDSSNSPLLRASLSN